MPPVLSNLARPAPCCARITPTRTRDWRAALGRLGGSLAGALVVPAGGLVVDVGGGAGELLASVLAHHVSARGILFDLAHALTHAPAVLGRHGVQARCALQEGGFFDGVPPRGDLDLMKSVLHDWGDEQVALILDRCRQAMKPGAQLVLVDALFDASHFGLGRVRSWSPCWS